MTNAMSKVVLGIFGELIFCTLFIFAVKLLSEGSGYRQVVYLGLVISTSLIVTGQIWFRLEQKRSDVNRVAQASPHKWIWMLAQAFCLFIVEILNVQTFALHAPVAERDLVSRIVILVVLLIGGRILFADTASMLRIFALFLSLIPALLVFYYSEAESSVYDDRSGWVLLSLIMAVFLGAKRLVGRKFKEGRTHAAAMRISGVSTLPLFLALGYWAGDWAVPTYTEIGVYTVIFLITPLITVCRHIVFDSKLAPVVHDTCMYLGGLVLTFFIGRTLFPEDASLPLSAAFWALMFSLGAAVLLIKEEHAKMRL